MLFTIKRATHYVFWNIVFKSFVTAKWIVVTIVPRSVWKYIIVEKFGKMGIYVTETDDGKYDTTKYQCRFLVRRPRCYRRLAINNTLGLGESYMDGDWDSDDLCLQMKLLLSQPRDLHRWLCEKYLMATQGHTPKKSFECVEEHYNVGNDLYEKMLDANMNYTCGFWPPGTKDLEDAEIKKMDLVGRKLKLKPGMKVLDLGCGFGSTAKYLAKNFGVSVTGYNISTEQLAWARKSCEGLDVKFVQQDYRTAIGQFDAVYSIGLFEHVGHTQYETYFEVVKRCLKPDGLALVHCNMSSPGRARCNDWICKYIFQGGELPHGVDFYKTDLIVEDYHSLQQSYARTLRAWMERFNDSWPSLEANYGHLVKGGFRRMWNFYLASCVGVYEARSCQLAQVVFAKKERAEEYWSVRDHSK